MKAKGDVFVWQNRSTAKVPNDSLSKQVRPKSGGQSNATVRWIQACAAENCAENPNGLGDRRSIDIRPPTKMDSAVRDFVLRLSFKLITLLDLLMLHILVR